MMYNTYLPDTMKGLSPKFYVTFDDEYYIQLKVRLYLHFDPHNFIRIIPARCGFYVRPVEVSARTVCLEKSWMINCKKAKNIEASKFVDINHWQEEKEEIIKHYCDEIKRQYNINVDPNGLSYMHQFCWDMDCVEN